MNIFDQISLILAGARFETELSELYEWDSERAEKVQNLFIQALISLSREDFKYENLEAGIRDSCSEITDTEIKDCISILNSLIDQLSLVIDRGAEYVN